MANIFDFGKYRAGQEAADQLEFSSKYAHQHGMSSPEELEDDLARVKRRRENSYKCKIRVDTVPEEQHKKNEEKQKW